MKREWLIYVACAPLILATWPVIMLMWILWGQKLFWDVGPWFELKPNSWPARTWYRVKIDGEYKKNTLHPEIYGQWRTWGGTTLGLGGFLGPARKSEGLMIHEFVHISQYIVGCILGLMIGSIVFVFTGNILLSLSAWSFVPYLWFAASFALAWMRGSNKPMELYRNSFHELVARAIRQCYEDGDDLSSNLRQ